jgi:hypothetical protein
MDSLFWQTIDQQQQATGPAPGLVSMLAHGSCENSWRLAG